VNCGAEQRKENCAWMAAKEALSMLYGHKGQLSRSCEDKAQVLKSFT